MQFENETIRQLKNKKYQIKNKEQKISNNQYPIFKARITWNLKHGTCNL